MNISRSFGEPTMRCFKELSSLIKEKSDMIIFLYKEKDYLEETAAVDYYIIIEKNNSIIHYNDISKCLCHYFLFVFALRWIRN